MAMHPRKKVALLCGFAMLLLLLTACDSGYTPPKVSVDNTQADPVYQHSDFDYGGLITWDSSYTDIVRKYGQPDWITGADETLVLHYKEPVVEGYIFDEKMIWMNIQTGRIERIYDMSKKLFDFTKPPTDIARKMNDDVKSALISKYGTPNYVDDSYISWRDIYAETEICFFPVEGRGKLTVLYVNKHDYSNEERYTDVPTHKP